MSNIACEIRLKSQGRLDIEEHEADTEAVQSKSLQLIVFQIDSALKRSFFEP